MIRFYQREDGSIRDFMTPEAAAISLMEIAIKVLRQGKGELFIDRVDEKGNSMPISDKMYDRYDDFAVRSLEDS